MSKTNLPGAAARASLAAGPTFLLLFVLFSYVQSAPAAMPMSSSHLAAIVYIPALVVPALLVGIVLAFPTCLVAGAVLSFAGDFFSVLRSPPLWIAAGAGLGLGALHLLDAMAFQPLSYAFTGTAMGCAAISRFSLDWE